MKTQDLKHIAPTLAILQNKGTGYALPNKYFEGVEANFYNELYTENLPNDLGQKTPDGYFNEVEYKVLSKLSLQEKEILNSNLPKDYFDTLEDRVFERLENEQEQEEKTRSLKKYWFPVAIAASFILFISIYKPFKQVVKLEISEIEAYIYAGNLDLNTYEIAEFYEAELNELTVDKHINSDELEDYLEEEIPESLLY